MLFFINTAMEHRAPETKIINPWIRQTLMNKAEEGYDIYIEFYRILDSGFDCSIESPYESIHREIMREFRSYSKTMDKKSLIYP